MFAKVQLLSQTLTVALCLSIPTLGYAQEIANPTTTPKVATLETIVEQVKSLIESMGYTDVKLSAQGKRITGTATKDGRQVTIVFDETGSLLIE
jgi:glutamate mutase epsilon subunit